MSTPEPCPVCHVGFSEPNVKDFMRVEYCPHCSSFIRATTMGSADEEREACAQIVQASCVANGNPEWMENLIATIRARRWIRNDL